MITREEAQGFVSRRVLERLIAHGSLRRVRPGVYVVVGSPSTWEQRLWAAHCWAGDTATVVGRSAIRLWGVGSQKDDVLEINSTRRLVTADVICHQWALREADVTRRKGFRLTSVERSLVDVAGLVPGRRFEEALDRALHLKLTALPRLRRSLDDLAAPGRSGIGMFREMLDVRDPTMAPHQSVLETRLGRLLRRHQLPSPITQYRVEARGRHVATLDFAYPLLRLGVETDGYEWHAGQARWKRDLKRRNALTNLGWRVLHLTWWDVTESDSITAEMIREAIAAPLLR